MLLVVCPRPQASCRRQSPDSGDATEELRGEEAGAPHLAVADDVDARLFLVAEGKIDGVVEHFLEVSRTELATLGGRDARHEPRRPGVRAHDAGAQLLGHPTPP